MTYVNICHCIPVSSGLIGHIKSSLQSKFTDFVQLKTDRNSVLVLVTVPKLAIFLVSVMAVIVKHGYSLLSVTAETTTMFRREPKLSLLAIR